MYSAENTLLYFLPSAFYLDDSHGEVGLVGQLLPDVSGGFRRGRESRFQDLQLLGFNGGPRPAPLPDGARFVIVVVVFIGHMSRLRVLPVVLRVLGVRRQARVAARGDCQEEKIMSFSKNGSGEFKS